MTRILILGGGFGGIRCALDLERKLGNKAEITLVDKNNFHLFVPDLYEVASAFDIKKDPFAVRIKKTVAIPYTDIFENKKVKFMQAEVGEVGIEGKKVVTDHGVLDFDYLVLAFGARASDFGIPGVKDYAYQFKTIEDALMINQKLETLVKQHAENQEIKPKDIFVIGAGFTGVELAGEMVSCSKNLGRICKIKGNCTKVTLFEAGPKILPVISEKERRIIMNRLTRLGIIVMENCAIEEVGADFIKLKNGQMLHGEMVIWTAGIEPAPVVGSIKNLPLMPRGKIIVDSSLAVKSLKNVFALGDITEFIDPVTQRPVPALAYVAADQGKIAARNIISSILDKPSVAYQPVYNLWVAPVGGKFALAHLWKGMRVNGFWGWVIRELIDLRYLLSILPPKKAISLFWQEVTMFVQND